MSLLYGKDQLSTIPQREREKLKAENAKLRLGALAAASAASLGMWAASHSPNQFGSTRAAKPVPQAELQKDPKVVYTLRAGDGPDTAIANVEPSVLTGNPALKTAVETFIANQGSEAGQPVEVPLVARQEQKEQNK